MIGTLVGGPESVCPRQGSSAVNRSTKLCRSSKHSQNVPDSPAKDKGALGQGERGVGQRAISLALEEGGVGSRDTSDQVFCGAFDTYQLSPRQVVISKRP